jgi:allantoinase
MLNSTDLIVRGRRVVTPEGERAAAIHIRDGVIAELSAFDDIPSGSRVHEAGGSVVIPGLVDTHVHINEPGRTEWEGFATATQAAAAGGVTTLIEMPLNSIPATTTAPAYQEKLAAAQGKLQVDTGFWGGVVPGNTQELRPLWEAGVFGFKCFLVPSGVTNFSHVTDRDLRAALAELAVLGAPLLVHAESFEVIFDAIDAIDPPDVVDRVLPPSNKYSTWLAYRPRAAENEAVAYLIRLAQEFHVHIHIVHLSSSDTVSALRSAKSVGVSVTVETCPHYLTFIAEEIPDGATQFKCAPPIRERESRELLWAALRDSTIDLIASDHSPCPPYMKLPDQGDFLVMWTEARSRGYALNDIARWMCSGPARLAGLANKKGAIAAGGDADLVIFNPDAKFRVDPTKLLHRHKLTPYAGRELTGVVEATFLRGQKIFDRGAVSEAPAGQVLRRGK